MCIYIYIYTHYTHNNTILTLRGTRGATGRPSAGRMKTVTTSGRPGMYNVLIITILIITIIISIIISNV